MSTGCLILKREAEISKQEIRLAIKRFAQGGETVKTLRRWQQLKKEGKTEEEAAFITLKELIRANLIKKKIRPEEAEKELVEKEGYIQKEIAPGFTILLQELNAVLND